METIIIKPKSDEELKEVLAVLKKMNVKTEVYKERTKEEILDSIERGAKEAADYMEGKIELKDAKTLLDEL